MYINFTSHNTEKGSSSSELFSYLEKENSYLKEQGGAKNAEEFFFNQNMDLEILRNSDSRISMNDAIAQIDANRGTQNLKSANFFMLNISPSEKELSHLENLVVDELANRGLIYEDIKGNSEILGYYNEQKEELMRMQLKLYSKEVMKIYADEMDREVYVNQDALPDNKARKEMKPIISDEWNNFLQQKGIIEKITTEKVVVPLEQEVKSNSEKGRFFLIENEKIFIPNYLIEKKENSISVDKEFLERQLLFSKYKNETATIDLNVLIKKDQSDKIQVEMKPTDYENSVVMWINKRDILEQNNSTVTLKKHRGDFLMQEAIKRDIEDNKAITLKNTEFKEKVKTGEKENYIFEIKKEGLDKPLKLRIDSSQVVETEKGFELKNHIYSKAYDNALNYNVNNQFSKEKEEIKHKVWQENGFDTTKRKLEHSDLLYFGKVEKDRVYKFDDKSVLHNKEIFKQISSTESPKEKLQLEKSLKTDKHTGEIIQEGLKKGGLNYHVHVVVSRHDGFNKNPLDKVSMSPESNQKNSTMNHGKKVGFDRKDFREKTEFAFDKSFDYKRPIYERFVYKNSLLQDTKAKTKNFVVSEIKSEILKKTGLYEIKRELNPVANIKKEISVLPIPTSLPKSKLDLIFKAVKMIKNVAFDKGISH